MDSWSKLKVFLLLLMVIGGLLLVDMSLAQEGLAQTPAKVEPGKALVPFTQELLDQLGNAKIALDTSWTLVAAFLVMFMALGFAMLESGFCRAKNVVNILSKNFIVFALTSLSFTTTMVLDSVATYEGQIWMLASVR